jgi:hypothetical protein
MVLPSLLLLLLLLLLIQRRPMALVLPQSRKRLCRQILGSGMRSRSWRWFR